MTLIVSMLMAPAVLYLFFRLYNILRRFVSKKWWYRCILPLFLASFYLFPLIGFIDLYLTGEIEVLKYPKPLVYWFWFGLVFLFQLATWVIIADLIKVATQYIFSDENRTDRTHALAVTVLSVIVFCYTGYKVYSDTTNIETHEMKLEVDQLPDALNGFKIVHITDIQGDEYTGREEISNYIQEVKQQNANLIVFTGDLISYGTDFIKQSAEELGKAQATYGMVAVVGDHDYWAGVEPVQKALEKEGITLLQDQNFSIEVDSAANILVTGVTEVYSKSSDPAVVDSLTRNSQDASLKIFASHQVQGDLIKSAQASDYDMLLAGHTHGGQVRVPFLGMNFSASERETKYVSGLYWEGDLPINVNNGLGFTLAPIRYDAPPEVTVIELKTGS